MQIPELQNFASYDIYEYNNLAPRRKFHQLKSQIRKEISYAALTGIFCIYRRFTTT